MAYSEKIERGSFAALRAPDAAKLPLQRITAGPFDPAGERVDGSQSLSDALITGLLIVYPALATVVALLVGLSLAGPVV